MPSTMERPDNNRPPEVGRILEKLRRRGADSLTEIERLLVVQIYRAAAMTGEQRVCTLRDDIAKAHLDFCFRLPTRSN